MYARIVDLADEASRLKPIADRLVRENSFAPLPLFEYGSDQDEQDHWMRGK